MKHKMNITCISGTTILDQVNATLRIQANWSRTVIRKFYSKTCPHGYLISHAYTLFQLVSLPRTFSILKASFNGRLRVAKPCHLCLLEGAYYHEETDNISFAIFLYKHSRYPSQCKDKIESKLLYYPNNYQILRNFFYGPSSQAALNGPFVNLFPFLCTLEAAPRGRVFYRLIISACLAWSQLQTHSNILNSSWMTTSLHCNKETCRHFYKSDLRPL